MSNQRRARGNQVSALLAGLAGLVRGKVIGPVRRHASSRGGQRELARLDDHLLRDIGLTRSQAHAAAYGLLRLGKCPEDASRAPPSGATAPRLAKQAARG